MHDRYKVDDRAGANLDARAASRACLGNDHGDIVVIDAQRIKGTCPHATAESEAAVHAGLRTVTRKNRRMTIGNAVIQAPKRGFLVAPFAFDDGHPRLGRRHADAKDVADGMRGLRSAGYAAGRVFFFLQ